VREIPAKTHFEIRRGETLHIETPGGGGWGASGNTPTAYDHAKKAGLVGSVRKAKRDLSTNPKHFDGFGRY
jgi:N-methylhydantoinase B/oxoprolinase/acetone carboxylase alpha subunit